jgi:predicted transglutaminase-like cysteine proteinase
MNGNNARNLMKEWRDFSNASYEVMLKSSLPKVKELIHFLDKEVSLLKDDVEKIKSVDQWFNQKVEYRTDFSTDRGKRVDYESSFDIWKDIEELLENGGDCEDYVFGKYVALKYLGFDKQLSFVIGKKRLNGLDISHAILACDLEKNGKYLLDNTEDVTKSSEEYSVSRVKPFRPLVLFNTGRDELYRYFFV